METPQEWAKKAAISDAANNVILQAQLLSLRGIVAALARKLDCEDVFELCRQDNFLASTKKSLETFLKQIGDTNPGLAREVHRLLSQKTPFPSDDPDKIFSD
jgi:hypothetical protein